VDDGFDFTRNFEEVRFNFKEKENIPEDFLELKKK
jgi:hypothetical protein